MSFSYDPAKRSPRASLVDGGSGLSRYENALVVFLSIEISDVINVAGKAARHIVRLARRFNSAAVVVVPNVHLTSTPAADNVALEMVRAVTNQIGGAGIASYMEPFGYVGTVSIVTKAHELSVIGRRFK